MLLQRLAYGASALTPSAALEIATCDGAQVLGRSDCGSLDVGKCADVVIWDMDCSLWRQLGPSCYLISWA